MIYEKNIPISAITDGTSQTILVGESPEAIHAIWIGVRNVSDQSAPINTPATFAPQYVFFDFGQEISSYHDGGALALFADGSVHFLSEDHGEQDAWPRCARAAATKFLQNRFRADLVIRS